MANELKPCPFCGGRNLDTYYCDIEGWIAHIKCDDCDDMIGPMSEFKYETKEEAYEDASKRWNTRPAAPVEGLETVSHMAKTRTGWIITPSYSGQPVVTRPQAEAIIAAKEEAWKSTYDDLHQEYERAEADNAALTARVKELDQRCAEILKQQDKGWRDLQTRAEALETQLAAARKALEFISGIGFVAAKDAPAHHDEAVKVARAALVDRP